MSIIVAIDKHDEASALALADQLDPKNCRLKVGKELFTGVGTSIIKQLHQRGFEIFLDLKFHDIPNTTAQAVLQASELGVWMVNVHASGGRTMMQTTAERLKAGGYATQLIAVTVLTSMEAEDLAEVGIARSPKEHALALASLAKDSGMMGVVCSAQEASDMRREFGNEFILVTPGIRPAGSRVDDQKRIMTPKEALQAGSTHLVIGRPITGTNQPNEALLEIIRGL